MQVTQVILENSENMAAKLDSLRSMAPNLLLVFGSIDLLKSVKQATQLVGCNADTGVRHFKANQ